MIGTMLGTLLGLVAGFFRGTVDWLIMLAVDAQLAMPFIIIAIAAIAAFGKGIPILVILAGISGWMLFARACRSTVLSLREREFITAAQALGASNGARTPPAHPAQPRLDHPRHRHDRPAARSSSSRRRSVSSVSASSRRSRRGGR